MKDYVRAHTVFVSVTGSMTLIALILFFGVAYPSRSAASDASDAAGKLEKVVKSSEGSTLSGSARRQLEGEVEGLRAREKSLVALLSPPVPSPGSDPVVFYGERLEDFRKLLSKLATDKNVIVPDKLGFPSNPAAEDVVGLLGPLEMARRLLPRLEAAGVTRIDIVAPQKDSGDFLTSDMSEAGAIKRTMVVFEVQGPTESLAKLLHSIEQREGFFALSRARLSREKPEATEATLKIAVGAVEVSDVKPKGQEEESGFIFGR